MEIETSRSGEGESWQLRSKLTSLQRNLFLKTPVESTHKSAHPPLLAGLLQQQRAEMMTKLCESWVKERRSLGMPHGTFCLPADSIIWFKKKKKFVLPIKTEAEKFFWQGCKLLHAWPVRFAFFTQWDIKSLLYQPTGIPGIFSLPFSVFHTSTHPLRARLPTLTSTSLL